MNTTKSIFSYPDYLRMFTARLVSTIGDKFFSMALAWWIIDSEIENGKSLLGIIMGASTLGLILFAPFMGTLADRHSRKRCMMAALLGGALVIALVLVFFPAFLKFPLLFALVQIVLFGLEPLFETSMQSSLNHVVSKETLPQAVAATSGIVSVSQVIGASLAGLVIVAIGIKGAFMVDILSFLISIYFIWRITTLLPVAREALTDKKNSKPSFLHDLKEGFYYVYKEKALLYLLLFFALSNFFIAPIILGIPILVKETFQGTALLMSLFEAAQGLGIIVGMIIFSVMRRKINRYSMLFYGAISFSIMYFPIMIKSQYIVCVSLFMMGITLQMVNISAMTLFQNFIPDYIKGRVFSVLHLLAALALPMGFSITGFLAEQYEIQILIMFSGIIMLLTSLLLLIMPKLKMNYII